MAQTIDLTGDAVQGLSVDGVHRAAVANLPMQVALGRNTPKARPNCLRLEDYADGLQQEVAAGAMPVSADWYTKAASSIARMYLNDKYGDCVIAGKAHLLGAWSANDPDSFDGQTILATDKEIYSQYVQICGPGDRGCNIASVLNFFRDKGLVAGGKTFKIDGYVSADWRSKEITQLGIHLFGGGCIGINLPQAWTSAAVWDVTNTRNVGGHDVSPLGFGNSVLNTNKDGVVVSSWGRLYLITWAAWQSTRWLDELYFMVPSFLWTGTDGMSPSGATLTQLRADLKLIGGGTLPPLPDTPVPDIDWSIM